MAKSDVDKQSRVSHTSRASRLTILHTSSYSALSLMSRKKSLEVRSTTVLLVRSDGRVEMADDGQVTVGETVMKGNARKVRQLYNHKSLAAFAGASGCAFSLLSPCG